jgi:hypothetical protein
LPGTGLADLARRQTPVGYRATGVPVGARARHAILDWDVIHAGIYAESQDREAKTVGGFHGHLLPLKRIRGEVWTR